MASTGYEAARRLEAGNNPKGGAGSRTAHGHGRTAHNMSSSSLRKKSDLSLVSKVRCGLLRAVLTNLQEIFLGTKLFILFPAIPLAIAANYLHFGRHAVSSGEHAADASPRLGLSRACSIVMLLAYVAYLFFQLKTHRQLFESEEVSVNTPNPFQPKPNELEMVFSSDEQEEDDDNDDAVAQDEAVIGLPTALAWLLGMTAVIAILSEYVVGTIEVPLSVIVAWIMGIKMDLDLELLETGSLIMAILITAFTLQVYTLLWITYTLRS
ncbi:hypothetical protein BHE74_00051749 [Ensete ventricosum]|nr:hypothetical protein BHE74_00051749 [Ensete ventricosum]